MSGSATADAAFVASKLTNPSMYRVVWDAIKYATHPELMTTDKTADLLGKANLVLHKYLEYTTLRCITRNGHYAEVLRCTNKDTSRGFHCPTREPQKKFLLRMITLILTKRFDEAIDALQLRHDGLRR